jgi:ubiquinone/menaquinone biosynthesis C-methylase UbiE
VTGERGLDGAASFLTGGRDRGASDRLKAKISDRLAEHRDKVLENASIQPGDTVLDAGVGTGLLSYGALGRVDRGGLVVGLDVSRDALEICRADKPGGPLAERTLAVVQGDCRSLPFGDSTFDVAMTRSVLMYLQDRRAALREVCRVLRPGAECRSLSRSIEPLPILRCLTRAMLTFQQRGGRSSTSTRRCAMPSTDRTDVTRMRARPR